MMSVPDTHAARRTVLRGQHGRGLLGTLVVCALVATAAALAFAWYQYHRPLAMKGERIEVRIPAGASTRTIARLLQDAGLVVDAPSFLAAVKATDAAHNLRAGRYEFARGVSLQDIVAKLRAGDVLRERLTIVEGWTFREMRAELARNPDLRQDSAKLDTARAAQGDRRDRIASRGPVRARHLRLRSRLERSRRAAPGVPLAGCSAAEGLDRTLAPTCR